MFLQEFKINQVEKKKKTNEESVIDEQLIIETAV